MKIFPEARCLAPLVILLAAAGARSQDTIDPMAEPVPPGEQQVPVAEDDIETATVTAEDEYAVPQATPQEALQSQFERFRVLLGEGVLDEADSVAKRVVELSIQLSGPRSDQTAKALTNLAIVQHRQGQFELAEQNFQTAIDIIEENADRLDGELINPLTGLGAAQLEAGHPDEATETLGRAVHVSHVNEGPHNVEQISILETLAEANLRLGAVDEARAVQDMIYALNVRHSGDNAIDLVPSLMRRAEWQHRAGMIFDERATYRRIIRIIETANGKDDLELVDPLILLGQSFNYVDLSSGTPGHQPTVVTSGEIYFRRAVNIAEDNPEADWRLQAKTNLSLADYYMVQGVEQRARGVYGDVWTALSDDEERMQFRKDSLQSLVTLAAQPLPEIAVQSSASSDPAGSRSRAGLQRGVITMSYAVSTRGRAAGLKIIEAQPPELAEFYREIQREMRRRVFRPYHSDGQPVTSPEQILSHRFYYQQSDVDEIRRQAAQQGTDEEGDST